MSLIELQYDTDSPYYYENVKFKIKDESGNYLKHTIIESSGEGVDYDYFTVLSEEEHGFLGFALVLPAGTYTLEQITDIDGNETVYKTQEVEVVSSIYEKRCPVFQVNYQPIELDKTYAIGEYAWVDEDADGIFNEDE